MAMSRSDVIRIRDQFGHEIAQHIKDLTEANKVLEDTVAQLELRIIQLEDLIDSQRNISNAIAEQGGFEF